ncbi:hypothetical protein BD309DRAFT_956043 [Dichomitus squalens]|nr:hypothetical protein BD309DRAFT_956043 [Dichomitus squalens]
MHWQTFTIDVMISFVDAPRSLCERVLVCHDWITASRHYLLYRNSIRPARSYDSFVEGVVHGETLPPWLGRMHTFVVEPHTSSA